MTTIRQFGLPRKMTPEQLERFSIRSEMSREIACLPQPISRERIDHYREMFNNERTAKGEPLFAYEEIPQERIDRSEIRYARMKNTVMERYAAKHSDIIPPVYVYP